jgi:hypothetical protein
MASGKARGKKLTSRDGHHVPGVTCAPCALPPQSAMGRAAHCSTVKPPGPPPSLRASNPQEVMALYPRTPYFLCCRPDKGTPLSQHLGGLVSLLPSPEVQRTWGTRHGEASWGPYEGKSPLGISTNPIFLPAGLGVPLCPQTLGT